jgi:hypothetical protein
MSLSNLAAIGSFVSGFAVLVSLIYLGLQVKQAERNQRALMQQGRSTQQVDLLLRNCEQQISRTRLRSYAGDVTMDDQEVDTAIYLSLANWRCFEDGFLQHKAGTIDEASFLSDTAIIRFIFTYPSQRATWRLVRDRFAPDFRDFADKIMRETKASQPPAEAQVWRRYVSEELAAAAS